jgi:hypothetical protein
MFSESAQGTKTSMKVYVHTDIEGVAGVTFFENSKDPSVDSRGRLS